MHASPMPCPCGGAQHRAPARARLHMQLVAEVQRPPLRQSSAIVSSLEFDKEGALFATAGVSKRIRCGAGGAGWRGTSTLWCRSWPRAASLGYLAVPLRHCVALPSLPARPLAIFPPAYLPLTSPRTPPLLPSRSIFEFASVVPSAASPGLHTPVVELVSRSKLSCLSWNKYIQAHIASSDYEGAPA